MKIVKSLNLSIDRKFWKGVFSLVVIYFLMLRLSKLLVLNESAYFESVILPSALKSAPFIIFLSLALVLTINNKVKSKYIREQISWKNFEFPHLRHFVFILVIAIGWAFSFYSYNFYFDQTHIFDRTLIILLVIGVYISPIFVIVFVSYISIIIGQFNYPASIYYSYTDKQLLLDILLLFSAFLILRVFLKLKGKVFLFTLLALIASNYFFSGILKLRLGVGYNFWEWIVENNLGNITIAAFLNGWLDFLDPDLFLQMANIVTLMAVPFQLMTVLIELVLIFAIANRRAAIAMLFGAFILHLMIFSTTGIFFWKWMIIDIGLAVVLWLDREIPIIKDLFRPANLLLFIPLVLFSGYYFDPASLGWWDSNISNFFKFEVITENGNVYNFPTSRFEPYNLPFAQSRFYFLYDEAILSGTYGAATNRESWAALRIAEDQNSIEAVRQEYGRILYDEERAEDFLEFLLIWFTNFNAHINKDTFLFIDLGPPQHIVTFESDMPYLENERISSVNIIYFEYYYSEGKITLIKKVVLRNLNVLEN